MVNSTQESLLIKGARIVTPGGVREDHSLLIEKGRISRIFDAQARNEVRQAEKVLTLDKLTLLPGFIDVHTHGAAGVDVMEASADDIGRAGLYLARHGVTGWLPTLVPAPLEDYKRAVMAVEECMRDQFAGPRASRALGIHYEGPFVSSEQCGALRPAYFRTFKDASDLDALPVLNRPDAVHMMTLAPEIEGGCELARELNGRGWVAAIGHTRAGLEALDRALESGARHMTHFFNAMPQLHHRAPGPVGWGLVRDDVTCDVIADGVHVDTLVLGLLLRMKSASRVVLISDSVAPAGLGDGRYNLWGETITVKDGRTRNGRGSIAGSVINLNDAARLVRSLGCSDGEIALMASENPARLLGVQSDYGTIEEGKCADLVALDDEYGVRMTIVGGRVVFDAEQDDSDEA